MGNCNFATQNQAKFIGQNIEIKRYGKKKKSAVGRGFENDTDDGFYEEHNTEQDIYEYVHCRVKRLIKSKGRYQFHTAPSNNLESRPIRTYKNGDRYLGQWDPDSNTREGQGVEVYINNSIYEGYWIDDLYNGHGRMIYPDGEIYEGEWLDGNKHGQGTYQFSDGSKYT